MHINEALKNMEPTKAKIGYIIASEQCDNVFMGGLLVTDQKGLPIEFRYTDPVTPTKLQRIIYGSALDRYLIVEVIARSLVESISDKPDIFITNSRLILELSEVFKAPLISIQQGEESPFPELGYMTKLPTGDFLMQIHPSGSPVHIAYTGDPHGFEKIQPLLAASGSKMDLIEPLRRIEKALDEILASSERRG